MKLVTKLPHFMISRKLLLLFAFHISYAITPAVPSADLGFNALKTLVQHSDIAGACSQEKTLFIMNFLYSNRPTTCVEIGVFRGASLLPIAATLKYLNHGHLYAIDTWSNEDVLVGIPTEDPNYEWWNIQDFPSIKETVIDLLEEWEINRYCTILEMPSNKAISQIQEIDFLHLDGNFSAEGSFQDASLYLPKVKPGGYILLSNTFKVLNQTPTKMAAMWTLFDHCELLAELDQSNTLLFRKH